MPRLKIELSLQLLPQAEGRCALAASGMSNQEFGSLSRTDECGGTQLYTLCPGELSFSFTGTTLALPCAGEASAFQSASSAQHVYESHNKAKEARAVFEQLAWQVGHPVEEAVPTPLPECPYHPTARLAEKPQTPREALLWLAD